MFFCCKSFLVVNIIIYFTNLRERNFSIFSEKNQKETNSHILTSISAHFNQIKILLEETFNG